MRIVGGRHRGRALAAPPGRHVRPTGDRVREALFNVLEHGRFAVAGSPFHGRPVLDACAGTGALGLEALSRGASHATFIEQAAEARAALRQNLDRLGEAERATILAVDVTRPPRATAAVAVAFLDPPYEKGLAPTALTALAAEGWLAAGTLAVVELGARENFVCPVGFEALDERAYGAARLIFLART